MGWFVFGMQYGFPNGSTTSAIQPSRQALLMNCLYSQFVNEWAIPLHKGPEALRRLSSRLRPSRDPLLRRGTLRARSRRSARHRDLKLNHTPPTPRSNLHRRSDALFERYALPAAELRSAMS